jgi:GntR family transcriptional repressor for pyruvate dehydrogenase complex
MRELIEEIVAGDAATGTMLPREVDLAQRFAVSRGVAREVIRGLEERGLVAVTHGRGAEVAAPDRWDSFDPEVLTALLAAPDAKRFLTESLECQRLVEVQAAGLAAERAERADVEALTTAADRLETSITTAGRTASAASHLHAADMDFHRAVVRAAGNRVLSQMAEPLHRALQAAVAPRATPGTLRRRLAEHRDVLSAITAGDAVAARAAMDAHLSGR